MRTDKQDLFIEQYCLTGNASKAAEKAGYAVPKTAGHKLKNQFSGEIEERTRKMLQDAVPAALGQLRTLSNEALSEAVRLGAVRDILDRAGYKPVERVESTSRIETASMDDLRRELEALTGSEEAIPDRLN